MRKIQIMTDSASDISATDEKQHKIAVIPFPIMLGGKSYTSRIDFDNQGFYALMAEHDALPTTSQVTPFQFVEIYHQQARSGVTDLILVLINSRGSSTYDNSVQAVRLFHEEHPEYPDFRVHSFDGMGYSAGYGAPVVEAAKMVEAGVGAEEICAYLEEILPRRQVYFGIYDLKYAAKSGRIPTAAAFLGNKLNLKPVMKIFNREITTAAKCRGEKNLVEKTVQLTLADMEPGTPYQLVYGCDESCLTEIAAVMRQALGYEADSMYQIGAAVAANAGPKVVGVAFIRKKD